MFEKPNYTYRIRDWRVIDGDTIDVTMDLGCHVNIHRRLRLLELDTDELRGGTSETKARAQAAKERITDFLKMGDVYIQTEMDSEGKYGRLLAWVWVRRDKLNESTGETEEQFININKALVEEGYQKGDTTIQHIY